MQNVINVKSKVVIIVLVFAIYFSNIASNIFVSNCQAELAESKLFEIRNGFAQRVDNIFDEQKVKVNGAFKDNTLRRSGWNSAQRYSYPRIEYATINLLNGQNIEEVNAALIEHGDYYIEDPERVLHRDNFHWHSEMALRLIEMFGQNGTKTPGLIKLETETRILEAAWLYCKRRQQDQTGPNTIAEDDHKISNTWYIYESENHHSQSLCTQWHFSKLVKDRPRFKNRKYDDGRIASEHFESWNEYLKMYFTERAKKGMFVEMMSRDYNHKLVKGIFNVYDFANDNELKTRAGMFLDLYFTYWGQEQIDGRAGGGKSRLYQNINPGTSEYGYLFFGIGNKPGFNCTLLSAMTTSYRPSLIVVDIVCDREGRGNYEVLQRPLGLAEDGFYSPPVYHMRKDYGGIVRYSYCTPDFIIGTLLLEPRPKSDWTLISSQNRTHGVIFTGSDTAAILPQCKKSGSRAYNTQWSVQKKGTLICQKLKYNTGALDMRVWFSEDGLSEPTENNGWVFSETQGAYAAVRIVDGGHYWEDSDSRTKGKWLYCKKEYSPVILEVDQKSNYLSFEEFSNKITGNDISFTDNILKYAGIYGDTFTFYADYSSTPKINGMPVNYALEKAFDSPYLKSDLNSGIVHIQKGKRRLVLDFN